MTASLAAVVYPCFWPPSPPLHVSCFRTNPAIVWIHAETADILLLSSNAARRLPPHVITCDCLVFSCCHYRDGMNRLSPLPFWARQQLFIITAHQRPDVVPSVVCDKFYYWNGASEIALNSGQPVKEPDKGGKDA